MSRRIRRIVLLEDHPTHARLAKLFLTSKGYKVTTCFTGEDVLSHVGDPHVDMFILDVQISDSSFGGLDIAELIREKNPEAQVLMVTAYKLAQVAEEAKARGLGDLPILGKPFRSEDLIAAVKQLDLPE